MNSHDTIFALASGGGTAAIAIVRLSGPLAAPALTRLAGALPPPRHASLRKLRHPTTGEVLDAAIVLWFPQPASFTGEDAGEMHIHGGSAVKVAVLDALGSCGLRPAGPGEFTRRAFENGRLDLAQAEGLADLLDAATERQRRQAMRQMGGRLGRAVATWRGALLEAAALLEAEIDFSDEADVSALDVARVLGATAPVTRALAAALSARGGERLREGWTVAIVGPPNAGKSTLLNRLAEREAAIVSPIAGTTRDTIEVHLDLDGYPFTLVDTAGLRDSDDAIEMIGIARARAAAACADLVVHLDDGTDCAQPEQVSAPTLRVRSKSELGGPDGSHDFRISAETGEGMAEFRAALVAFAARASGDEPALITQARHRTAFSAALAALERLPGSLNEAIELAAEDLRIAGRALQDVIGGVDAEDVLGEIFGRFCIGK